MAISLQIASIHSNFAALSSIRNLIADAGLILTARHRVLQIVRGTVTVAGILALR
jgi:hypothetical protein